MRPTSRLLTLLAFGLACTAPAVAEQSAVLGANGTVYTVQTGTLGELFPDQAWSANAGNPVLALDTMLPGQPATRQMVPDTGGTDIETLPYLVVDDTDTLFLIWLSRANVSSLLFVRSLQGDSWGELMPVLGNSFSLKRAPQLAVTRDSVLVPTADGGTRRSSRTVLHLVWWEDSGPSGRVVYAPLVLTDGVYHEQDQTSIVLTDFDAAADSPDTRVSAELYQSPRLLRGQSDQSVVVGFANPANGHFTTVESTVLPNDLGGLADAVRAHIITGGLKWQANLGIIGDAVRAHIITGGRGGRINARVLGFLGDAVRAHIITGGIPATNLTALGEDARSFLLQSGAGLLQGGLVAADSPGAVLVEQPGTDDGSSEPLLQIRVVASRPAPLTGPGLNSIYLSDDGVKALVAWENGPSQILYRESTADGGWNAPVTLRLGNALNRDAAYRLLDQRLRSR